MQKANAVVLCRSETGCKEDLTHKEQVLSFYAKEKGYAVTGLPRVRRRRNERQNVAEGFSSNGKVR